MAAIQIGIILFLISVLIIVSQDEYKRRRLARKSAKVNSFWTKDQERRKCLRINTEIDVLYEVVSGIKSQKRGAISKNISLGGINLALDEKLVPGTKLQIQLNIPQGPKPIFAQGEIVWIEEISEKFSVETERRHFAAGIQFTQLRIEDETVLKNFVNHRIRNVRGQDQN